MKIPKISQARRVSKAKQVSQNWDPEGFKDLCKDLCAGPRPHYSEPHQVCGETASQRIHIQVYAAGASSYHPERSSIDLPCLSGSGAVEVVELGSVRSGGLLLSALRIPAGLSLSCFVSGGEILQSNAEPSRRVIGVWLV